jgi:hypothetical protein
MLALTLQFSKTNTRNAPHQPYSQHATLPENPTVRATRPHPTATSTPQVTPKQYYDDQHLIELNSQ